MKHCALMGVEANSAILIAFLGAILGAILYGNPMQNNLLKLLYTHAPCIRRARFEENLEDKKRNAWVGTF